MEEYTMRGITSYCTESRYFSFRGCALNVNIYSIIFIPFRDSICFHFSMTFRGSSRSIELVLRQTVYSSKPLIRVLAFTRYNSLPVLQ